ncbi:MAG TPA: energy transducer TonB [Bacteroidia bacterium]|nr:energy transducer TonB [Bacteroidia bacterium]
MLTTRAHIASLLITTAVLFSFTLKGQDSLRDPRAHQHHQLPLPIAPMFPGGRDSLKAYLDKNTHYPAPAAKKHITGIVGVDFTVDEKGNLINIKVSKSLSYSCDKEALRVIKHMPKWKPGMEGRNAKAMDYHVDVTFAEPEKK